MFIANITIRPILKGTLKILRQAGSGASFGIRRNSVQI